MYFRLLKSNPALALFALGFFCSSWDLLLTRKAGGFTLKAYQPLFLLCALLLFVQRYRQGALHRHLEPLGRPFALAFLALAFFYLGLSPWSAFPLKSFLYSCWMLFDIGVVWLSVQLLFEEAPAEFFAFTALGTVVFLALVIVADYLAYPFGFRGGMIGNNQDAVVSLGVSRPHAFSSEPSYVASVLCLGLFTTSMFVLNHSRRKWLAGAGMALLVFAILATTSRTGWGALAGGVFLLILLPLLAGQRFRWKPVLALTLAVPILSGIFLLTTPEKQKENLKNKLVDGLISGKDSSGVSRMKAMALAFDYAKDTKGLGTGLGASWRYFREHGGYEYNFQGPITERENGNEIIMSTWGQLLAEGGFVGPALFFLAAFFLTRSLWQAWQASGSALTYGSLTAAITMFGFLAFWLGNVCRGDVWVWYAIWSGFAAKLGKSDQAPL